MAARLQGRVTNVSDDDLGSSLDGDHAVGATTLKVNNAADFDEDGGTLVINDQQIVYTSCDDDTDTITLSEGLAAAADDGDTVSVWDTLREVIAVDKTAAVDVGPDYADDIAAVVALHLVDHLEEGPRGDDGESVILELDEEDDEWKVVEILGLGGPGASGTQFEADDVHVLTAGDVNVGSAVFQLSHRPVDESVKAFLGPLAQEPTEWGIDYQNRTVTLALSGVEEAGDRIWVHYAYRKGLSSRLRVPLGHVWKYATGLGASATYAATGFDDSAWASGQSPFGWREADYAHPASEYGTFVPSPMDVWTRLHVNTSGGDLTFTIGIDDDAEAYLDGTLIGTFNVSQSEAQRTVVVPAAAGAHVIAVHGTDQGNATTGTAEGGYLGVTIYEEG